MSENSSDEDISPVFAFRADNIMKKQREAYLDLLKKAEEDTKVTETVEDKEKELLSKIQEKLQKKPRGKRKDHTKAPPPNIEEKSHPSKRSSRRNKKSTEEDADKGSKSKMEESPSINLPAAAKRKLLKIDLENNLERKRIKELNKRVLKSCVSSTVDDQNISLEMETEQNVTLKINYLSETSKITVGENEKFSSIFSKIADLFKLKITEVTLCLREEIINFDETPQSLKVKAWEIIDCIPYKSAEEMQDDADSSKILIKMQSNDSKKKIDIYAHKLEKFRDIMERYANVRSLPLKDLIFEFDGEKINDSDTPDNLDMESGSCVDVKVIGGSLKSTKPSVPYVDLEKEEPPNKMIDICVLD
ncbi:unnamed protein product [Larinioides sclopetarius]|uniref:Rad60/SUMO-like domain-containing protein n=1 Tax=Larinioides sclopetarius TaxID=280406 RepID=A0AAV2A5U2_9ARAC